MHFTTQKTTADMFYQVVGFYFTKRIKLFFIALVYRYLDISLVNMNNLKEFTLYSPIHLNMMVTWIGC